ncbi:MAG: hypothetical protein ABJE10_20185 [bacterium]
MYAADARAQELPLVGGGEHDWAYLLGETGMLSHDQGVGRAFRAAGFLIIVLSTAWGLATATRPSLEAVDATA